MSCRRGGIWKQKINKFLTWPALDWSSELGVLLIWKGGTYLLQEVAKSTAWAAGAATHVCMELKVNTVTLNYIACSPLIRR